MSPQTSQAAALTEQDFSVADSLAEILEGLDRTQKSLSPKFFYDARGSKLFDEICELPEYYLTKTELAIMRAHIDDIAALVGPQASLIEFGSGSSLKTRILLDGLDRLAAYVPVDISREHLMTAAESLAADYLDIEVWPVLADFMQPFELPNPSVMPLRNIVYFPGLDDRQLFTGKGTQPVDCNARGSGRRRRAPYRRRFTKGPSCYRASL